MTAPYKRKLIEVALPLEAINVASAREKSIRHGHPSTLHLWWARRPLAACRAVLFASLVDDPSSDPDRFPTPKAVEDERTRLFDIIERLVQWENSTNEAVLEEARAEIRRSTGGNPPPVLDPFCGGGSIPLEAQRLGLMAYASDLNPVAVLITKALIEIPPRFANLPPVHPDARRGVGGSGAWKGAAGLAEDVRRYGAWMRDEAERRIGHLYPKVRLPREQGGGEATVIAWLWARTVICPNPVCGARMPLVRSFALSTKKGKEAWIEPMVDHAAKTVRFEVRAGIPDMPDGTVGRLGARCLVCASNASLEYIRVQGREKRMGVMPTAVVVATPRGRTFAPSPNVSIQLPAVEEPPSVPIARNPRDIKAPTYGLAYFSDLFTPRQLVALTTLADLVSDAIARVERDARGSGMRNPAEYSTAVGTYLALGLSKLADISNALVSWKPSMDQPIHLFTRQAIPMIWDFAETNPFAGAAGDLDVTIGNMARVLDQLPMAGAGRVTQHDASTPRLDVTNTVVSTDPPYYDNIEYAELSDFFYVWLRRSIGRYCASLMATLLTPKTGELVANRNRFEGDQRKADSFFEHGLAGAFSWMRECQDPRFPMTIYYAMKQAESEDGEDGQIGVSTGWEKMLEALLSSGLAVEGTWPIRTELATRVAMNLNMLASSIVLVCRPRRAQASITTRKDFVRALKRELPDALRTLQHGSIAPVDLAQASIGPGMSVFSRYAKVLEPDGSAMKVRTALGLINQALDEILAEQEGEFDADTRWAIAWYEQYGLNEAPYGSAETLATAKVTSISGLVDAGIVWAQRNKVRLLARGELDPDWDPATDRRVPVWEAMQRVVHLLLTEGETAAAELLGRLGGLGETARDLAYRLYHVAERKGWTDEARAYNALVIAWSDLSKGAELARTAGPGQATLGLA